MVDMIINQYSYQVVTYLKILVVLIVNMIQRLTGKRLNVTAQIPNTKHDIVVSQLYSFFHEIHTLFHQFVFDISL